MGILDSSARSLNNAKAFLENPFKKKVNNPFPEPDFPKGCRIVEMIDGKRSEVENRNDWVHLVGNMMPLQPFEWGGQQRITKEYYPGNSEPVIQILGPQEPNLVVRGRFKDKRYKDVNKRGVAFELQQQLNAIRIRGNLLELTLGEWRRFGFLEKVEFKMKTLADIEYSLDFTIIGRNPPQNYHLVDITVEVPFKINKDLIQEAANWQSTYTTIPDSMPQSLADIFNSLTNEVAGVIATVTGFVDSVLTQVEDVSNAFNRAIGVIRYAQISLFRYKERIGRLNINQYGSVPMTLGKYKTTSTIPAMYDGRAHIAGAQRGANDLMTTLESMRAQFAELSATVPLARYRTVEGDTLQKVAIKHYNDAGKWRDIYEHNNLTTTELVKGQFIEIPKA